MALLESLSSDEDRSNLSFSSFGVESAREQIYRQSSWSAYTCGVVPFHAGRVWAGRIEKIKKIVPGPSLDA
jgi:hypothetical protein